jgi:hypothetical protein
MYYAHTVHRAAAFHALPLLPYIYMHILDTLYSNSLSRYVIITTTYDLSFSPMKMMSDARRCTMYCV